MRIVGTVFATLTVATILYSWKAFTFAVWCNAALISHAHPLLVVSAIEAGTLGLAATVSWKLIDAVSRDLIRKR